MADLRSDDEHGLSDSLVETFELMILQDCFCLRDIDATGAKRCKN